MKAVVPFPIRNVDVRMQFFQLASQYYISGRFAMISGFSPVGANLLHHAVEMYLKGTLSHWKKIDELRKMKHNLKAIWTSFKNVSGADTNLDRFEDVVLGLDKFERLRYPDAALHEGMRCQFALRCGDLVPNPQQDSKYPPYYTLVLEEIDDLLKTILEMAGATPSGAFLGIFQEHAKTFLALHNNHVLSEVA